MILRRGIPCFPGIRCLATFGMVVWGLFWLVINPHRFPVVFKSVYMREKNTTSHERTHGIHQCRNVSNSGLADASPGVFPNFSIRTLGNKETRHVAFVKVHKAGSTTIMNVFERFAFTRDLFLALPPRGNIIYNYDTLFMPPPGGQFDMLINHVTFYNREAFAKVVPKNSKYIGIIREPLDLTVSAFEYYSRRYLLYPHIPGPDKLKTYMSDRDKYEYKNVAQSYTNNRMSFDFGLSRRYFYHVDTINDFLLKLDSEMDLIMVLERFAESLVLLKRKLCWQMKDILYVTRNKNKKRRDLTFTKKELAYHRNFSLADNMLYDYFSQRFQDQLEELDQDNFYQEVAHFKSIIQKLNDYCLTLAKNRFILGDIALLVIEASLYNERFNVTANDCRLMMYDEGTFCNISRNHQEKLIQTLDDMKRKT